jgi:hypothetical protein
VTTNASGAFAASVTIPMTATNGSHHIVVTGPNAGSGTRTITYPISVTGSTATDDPTVDTSGSTDTTTSSSPAALPRTGINIAILLFIAALLTLLGLNAVDISQWRRRAMSAMSRPVVGRPPRDEDGSSRNDWT